jgi:hypothetical protein
VRGRRLDILGQVADRVAQYERARDQRVPMAHAILLVAQSGQACTGGTGDAHALGAILYRLTVGTSPDADPLPPRAIMPRFPRKLEAIVLLALAGGFARPADLAQALYHFAAGWGLTLSSPRLESYLERILGSTALADTGPIARAG